MWGRSHTGHFRVLAQQLRPPALFHLTVSTSLHPLQDFHSSLLNKSLLSDNPVTLKEILPDVRSRPFPPDLVPIHMNTYTHKELWGRAVTYPDFDLCG